MTRVPVFDAEIGKGRKRNADDSSSSRESSPAAGRAPKRSFSPLSDDGDGAIQNRENDETPPPVERPIIRQPVAFSIPPTKVQVMTYEAPVEQPKKQFLPGQEVPLPPKPKGAKKKTGVKKPRKPDAYPQHTSRFKLSDYDPTPPKEPPIAHGSGPYSSLYRGVIPNVPSQSVHQESLAASSTNSTGVSQNGRSDPSKRGTFSVGNSNVPVPSNGTNDKSVKTTTSTPQPSSAQNSQPPSTPNGLKSSSSSQDISLSQAPTPRESTSPQPTSARSHSFVTDANLTPRERGSPSPYYRRNYDDKEFIPARERRYTSTNMSSKSPSTDGRSMHFQGYAHLVTLLITDIRNELVEPDHQLAEVKVPLKNLEHGWWANAKDIVEQLQAGASRIDGPARVFTMRGKYRQFILRVTADNKDEIVSANVPVSSEKTLKLTIEALNPPRIASRPVELPRDSWNRTYDEYSYRSEDRMEVDSNRFHESRKRHASPSFDEYGDYTGRRSPGNPSKIRRRDQGWDRSPRRRTSPMYSDPRHAIPNHDSWRSRSRDLERGRRSYTPGYSDSSPSPRISHTPLPSTRVGPGYPQRGDDDDMYDVADRSLISAVQQLLEDDVSNDYFKACASNKVCDVVRQYEAVLRMFKRWVGKQPPGFSETIEESHIVRALEIEEGDVFIDNCKETMALLDLYGKRGRTQENPRVMQMLNDQKPPPVDSDPARRLLRLLRVIDETWKNDVSGPVLNGIMPPPPDHYDKPGPTALK